MDLPETILQQINQGQTDSLEIANHLNVDHQKVIGAIKSLESLGNVISSESYVIKRWQLTEEGQQVSKNGSHEAIGKNGFQFHEKFIFFLEIKLYKD